MQRTQTGRRSLGVWLLWSCVAVVSCHEARIQVALGAEGLTESSQMTPAHAGDDVVSSGSTDALLDEAVRMCRQGKGESVMAAIALLERASRREQRSIPQLYFLAQAYRSQQDLQTSLMYFERVIERIGVESANDLALDTNAYAFWANFEYAEVLANELVAKQVVRDQQVLKNYRRLAVEHYEEALWIERTMGVLHLEDRARAGVHNTLGLLLLDDGGFQNAVGNFQKAITIDPTMVEPHANMALAMYQLGNGQAAVDWNIKALSLAPDEPSVLHNTGLSLQLLGHEKESLGYWVRAHKLRPNVTEPLCSLAGYYGGIGDMTTSVKYLQKANIAAERTLQENPQRLEARTQLNSIRLQLAMAQLPMLYQSTEEIQNLRVNFKVQLEELALQPGFVLPEALATTIGSGSMGYYAIYQGFNDVDVRSKLAEIYLKGAPFLAFTAPHVARNREKRYQFRPTIGRGETDKLDGLLGTVVLDRRIRVGFLSAFMRHHSVGLLTQGVISGLPRDRFEVFLILYNHQIQDDVTRRAQKAAENVVFLENGDIRCAQQQVATLELDVLVFTEIGMHVDTYFLSFSRLALRTAVFWGHATTSGIPAADYFISSSLFLDPRGGDDDQARHSECTYHMQHLTTSFLRPTPGSELANPRNGTVIRELLGLPSERTMPVMLLVPQTLYKFHPDFDRLLGSILERVPGSFLTVMEGNTPVLADQIRRRWRQVLSFDVYKRIYFVRRLETTEFFELAAAANVVLDPFPVGGGRSSFEVFAVGTPIVASVPRTSILQLTAGMYRAMEIHDNVGLAFSDEEFVEKVVLLASNHSARQDLHKRIRSNNHKLYDNPAVINEWETFLVSILAENPPKHPAVGPARRPDDCPNFQSRLSNTNSGTDRTTTSPRAPQPVFFEMALRFPGHSTIDTKARPVVTMRHQDDDPFEVAKSFAGTFMPSLDILQTAFIGKLLWNAQHRFEQRVVAEWNVMLPNGTTEKASHGDGGVRIEVRNGDDLDHTVRWQMLKARSPGGVILRDQQEVRTLSELIGNAITRIKQLIPEHSTPEWIAARALHQAQALAFDSKQDCALPSQCLTLLITTCGLKWTDWFRRVLVMDDNSSSSDRELMASQFPAFEFYFKKPEERGHARSLNIALALVETPFVLYLEDDWKFTSHRPAGLPAGFFLSQAMAILRSSRRHESDTGYVEPVVQVLLNDQHGGWPRSVQTANGSISYRLHEFATADPNHSFAYWPGFSLNPGMWDITALRHALGAPTSDINGSKVSWFDEESLVFERLFSLRVWRQGLLVAYLTHDVATHIGAPPGSNESAYVLNGFRRPFDG